MDVEKVPKQRWRLVRFTLNTLYGNTNKSTDLLHLSAKDGCMHPMREQELLSSFSCNVR